MDGARIANEIISWAKSNKKEVVLFQADCEKAFDSVDWSYLLEVLNAMGFSAKWRSWVRACLHSATTSVLVNSSPSNEFRLRSGLRQGDPLPPLIFIVAMEGLHRLMEEAKSKNMVKCIDLGPDRFNISHLFYADDALFIDKWSIEDGKNLIRILRCFFCRIGAQIEFVKKFTFWHWSWLGDG